MPESLGECASLQKLMLAGNIIQSLPKSIRRCRNLELLRLAANQLTDIPEWLGDLPNLAWLAIAGNPCKDILTSNSFLHKLQISSYPWSTVKLGPLLGDGASGETHRALITGKGAHDAQTVAIKIFKGEITSDGYAADELAASISAGFHHNLLTAQGIILEHPHGRQAIVLPLLGSEFRPVAGPPSMETCTRDVYAESRSFKAQVAHRIIQDIESAVNHLRERAVMHGDLYGHNVLVTEDGVAMLSDFGAATCFADRNSPVAKLCFPIEDRALQTFKSEILSRVTEDIS